MSCLMPSVFPDDPWLSAKINASVLLNNQPKKRIQRLGMNLERRVPYLLIIAPLLGRLADTRMKHPAYLIHNQAR